jgi:hypothetical protein
MPGWKRTANCRAPPAPQRRHTPGHGWYCSPSLREKKGFGQLFDAPPIDPAERCSAHAARANFASAKLRPAASIVISLGCVSTASFPRQLCIRRKRCEKLAGRICVILGKSSARQAEFPKTAFSTEITEARFLIL